MRHIHGGNTQHQLVYVGAKRQRQKILVGGADRAIPASGNVYMRDGPAVELAALRDIIPIPSHTLSHPDLFRLPGLFKKPHSNGSDNKHAATVRPLTARRNRKGGTPRPSIY